MEIDGLFFLCCVSDFNLIETVQKNHSGLIYGKNIAPIFNMVTLKMVNFKLLW